MMSIYHRFYKSRTVLAKPDYLEPIQKWKYPYKKLDMEKWRLQKLKVRNKNWGQFWNHQVKIYYLPWSESFLNCCGTRATREYMLHVVLHNKSALKHQFTTKWPHKFDTLMLLCIKRVYKLWSHAVIYFSHSDNRVGCNLHTEIKTKTVTKFELFCTNTIVNVRERSNIMPPKFVHPFNT